MKTQMIWIFKKVSIFISEEKSIINVQLYTQNKHNYASSLRMNFDMC